MYEQLYLHQKQFSLKLRTEPIEVRLEHLRTLETLIETHQTDFVEALKKDFKKPEMETLCTEIYPLISEIQHVRKKLAKWMSPHKASAPLMLKGAQSWIQYEPKGVCLIIAPWNYPAFLTLGPLISAIAAGNTVVIKPSELTPHTSDLLARLIKHSFSEEHVAIVTGGAETTQQLLQQPFDHIFFTGSTSVGKIIMTAAAKHLSSVTLELGGKSPTIIDSTADLDLAAEKLIWAKFMNAGQTCVAPDYLFIQENIYTSFLALLKTKLTATFGHDKAAVQGNSDFARIISEKHVLRLKELLEESISHGATISYGGDVNVAEKYMAPTIIENVDLHCKLMTEEIFGPLLPIMSFKEISEVIHFINERPKPLALYLYSQSEMNIEETIKKTSSGGLVINDSVIHLANSYLPFGGVGESGMGSSHGLHGFKAFSHGKSILRQRWGARFLKLMYPPYTELKLNIIKKFIHWRL